VAVPSRVIVGVSGSPACLPAMRYAADMARAHGAQLIPVLAWLPPGGDLAGRGQLSPALRQAWTDAARMRLRDALEAAFGGLPRDVVARPEIVRGDPGPALVRIACKDDDLLVIGTGRQSRPGRLLHASVSRYCLARATCPVLAVPPSPLEREIRRMGVRAWAFRRRPLHPEDIAAPTRG
jgi:nucleotide-binding universal stress UspA family protein